MISAFLRMGLEEMKRNAKEVEFVSSGSIPVKDFVYKEFEFEKLIAQQTTPYICAEELTVDKEWALQTVAKTDLDISNPTSQVVVSCLKKDAIIRIIRISKYHPNELKTHSEKIIRDLLVEIEKETIIDAQAALAIGILYMYLRPKGTELLKVVIRGLLAKMHDLENEVKRGLFLRAFYFLLRGINPRLAALEIIEEGCSYPSVNVREIAAQLVVLIVGKIGAYRALQQANSTRQQMIKYSMMLGAEESKILKSCGFVLLSIFHMHPRCQEILRTVISEEEEDKMMAGYDLTTSYVFNLKRFPIAKVWNRLL